MTTYIAVIKLERSGECIRLYTQSKEKAGSIANAFHSQHIKTIYDVSNSQGEVITSATIDFRKVASVCIIENKD